MDVEACLRDEVQNDIAMIYVCPTCKSKLKTERCTLCGFTVECIDQIPVFFSSSAIAIRYRDIGRFYDELYHTRQNAWKDFANRGEEFLKYTAALVETLKPKRYLDIGCGQGFLLSRVITPEKFGIDISRKAVDTARDRTTAKFCQGIVEELPYPNSYFDVITGIGVMEHFLDSSSALKEMARVSKKGGSCIVFLYLPTPFYERVLIKISQFIYPRFRPFRVLKWLVDKSREHRPGESSCHEQIVQPVQNQHTPARLKKCFRRSGFRVRSVITKRLVPDAPLEDHYFRFYILEKV